MSACIKQQTQEWHNLRAEKIGSSDAPVIMEVSPWSSPYQLWQQKILGTITQSSFAMRRGLDLEPKARNALSEMTGLILQSDVVFHPSKEWMMASLDVIDIDRKFIAEIKCPNAETHAIAARGKVPDHYYPQLQHQMEVCELGMAYYFSFDGEEGILLEVKRDEKYIQLLLEKEEEFFDCIKNLTPPKLGEKDYVKKSEKPWNDAALKLIQIRSQLSILEKEEKALEKDLIGMANNQNSIGGGIKISRYFRKGAINYGEIPELFNVDVEKYRKDPVECWRISQDKSYE